MTILEALVSTFILSLVFVGFMGSMSAVNTDLKKVQMQASRGDVSRTLHTNLSNRASIINSAEFDTNLNKCLNGNVAGGCVHFEQHEFNLYSSIKDQQVMDPATHLPKVDGSGNPVMQADVIGGVSGTTCATTGSSLTSVFYTSNGQHCACGDPAAHCPFQVITKYAAICATGTTCSKPAALKVFYSIKVRPDLPEDAAKTVVLRDESSDQIIDLGADDQYYVKFVSARSYDVNTTTGVKTISQSVTETDIRQGKGLSYGVPGYFEFEVNLVAPEDVTSIQLYRYVYPAACTLTNVGSGACLLPQASDYTALGAIPFTATKAATITVTDNVAVGRLMDYRVRSFNSSNVVVNDSRLDLRAYFKDTGTLSVTPPANLVFTCDPASTVNTFAFQAKSLSGWKTLTHTISPTLNYGGTTYTTIPGMDVNPLNTAVQNFVADPKYFAPGVTYTITFSGETNEGVIKKDIRTFTSLVKPAQSLTLSSPATATNVRTKNDLTVTMDVNLACSDTVTKMMVDIKKITPSTGLMNATDLVDSCAPLAGAPDENKFRCTKTLHCNEWLGVADVSLCESKFATDTPLRATAVVTSSKSFTQTKTSDFIAGAKVSVSIVSSYVQWVANNTVDTPKLTVSSIPTQVQLSSPLSPGESIHLALDGSFTHSTHTCGYSSSVNASYNTSTKICTLTMTTPNPVKGDVIALTSPDANVEIISPSNVVLLELNETQLSCSTITDRPTCTGGKTLKRKITTMGSYNLTYGDGTVTITGYKTVASDSAMDFFISYIPRSTTAKGSFAITLEKVVGMGAGGSADSFKSKFYTDAADMKVCTTSGGCPGTYTVIDGSLFSARRSAFPPGEPFDISFASVYTSNATQELIMVRECYCGP